LSSRSKCRDISYEKRDIPHPTQSTRQKTFRLQRKSKILRNSARLTDESRKIPLPEYCRSVNHPFV
jgi:hypothetical protein